MSAPAHQVSLIDSDEYARKLRMKSIKSVSNTDYFLITNLKDSIQETDISEGVNCQGYGRVHHFRLARDSKWVPNPLPQQVAAWRLGLSENETERAQVFQNASCNWRCWYCFVDFELLSALSQRSSFKSTDELIDLFLRENNHPKLIDISGGQPDIIPEWPLRMMESLTRRGLQNDYFLWVDDNLSLYYAWDYLKLSDFAFMKAYKNFGRVGCFKGFSHDSFQENTFAPGELLDRQLDIMSRWVNLGLDMYGYITLTVSTLDGVRQALRRFLDDVQGTIGHYFPLRTIPLEVLPFSPTKTRLNAHRENALRNQYDVLGMWKDELQSRYSSRERSLPIYNVPIETGDSIELG